MLRYAYRALMTPSLPVHSLHVHFSSLYPRTNNDVFASSHSLPQMTLRLASSKCFHHFVKHGGYLSL
jgi:hypothetical protein